MESLVRAAYGHVTLDSTYIWIFLSSANWGSSPQLLCFGLLPFIDNKNGYGMSHSKCFGTIVVKDKSLQLFYVKNEPLLQIKSSVTKGTSF